MNGQFLIYSSSPEQVGLGFLFFFSMRRGVRVFEAAVVVLRLAGLYHSSPPATVCGSLLMERLCPATLGVCRSTL